MTFVLSPGEAHDGPEGRRLLESLGPQETGAKLLMDRAYEGNATRELAVKLGYDPVAQPEGTLGIRPGVVQKAERSRAAVPAVEKVPPHLHAVRQAGCGFQRLHPVRAHL